MDKTQILEEADRCVKCGYCLPSCPTYGISANEGESPRGRIALIQGLLRGEVDTPRLHKHLDSCLACRSCEPACPSGVRYGKMITGVRNIKRMDGNSSSLLKASLTLLSEAPYHNHMVGIGGIIHSLGVTSLLAGISSNRVKRLQKMLPDKIRGQSWKNIYPASDKQIGRIAVFTGCVSRITEHSALTAGIRVLNRLGFEVLVPPQQRCCGAMHSHAGDTEQAAALSKRNSEVFNNLELDAVLSFATGCNSNLQNSISKTMVQDVSSFISSAPGITELKLAPLPKKVAIHTPCSMKNILKQPDSVRNLLGLIPEIELFDLPENGLCCGGAGLYLVTHPKEADQLREDKLAALKSSQPSILITSNTGCSMHLSAGVNEIDMKLEVLHPVELFSRQLAE